MSNRRVALPGAVRQLGVDVVACTVVQRDHMAVGQPKQRVANRDQLALELLDPLKRLDDQGRGRERRDRRCANATLRPLNR